MGNPFEYDVSFRVTHPSLHAAAISAQLRMTPEFCWTVGERRRTPKGTLLEGVRKESYCTYKLGSGDDGQLAQCLKSALDTLDAVAAFLREVREEGGSLMFYVFWYPNGDTGELFETDLLRRMADVGIDLGLNVYDEKQSS